MLTLTAEYQTLLDSNYFSPCRLVQLPGNLFLTDAPGDVVWKGNTYLSNGLLMSLGQVSNSTSISANTYTLTLDNTDLTTLALYGSVSYVGDQASIHVGLLDEKGSLIVDGSGDGPFEIYKGIYDSYKVDESSGKSTIAIKLKSHWAAFNRTAGRFTNSASQQEIYPGDSFFDYGHMEETDIKWGKPI